MNEIEKPNKCSEKFHDNKCNHEWKVIGYTSPIKKKIFKCVRCGGECVEAKEGEDYECK